MCWCEMRLFPTSGFTLNEDYVWYYHSGRKTVRLFRRHDASMISNYALSGEVTSVVTSSWSLIAGDRDGALTMLAIVDPNNKEKSGSTTQIPNP